MARDLTLEVLKQIRDEVKKTNQRLERLEGSQSETNQRLEVLARRQGETEVRLATESVAVAGAVRELRDTLLEDRLLRKTVDAPEQRITALEEHAH